MILFKQHTYIVGLINGIMLAKVCRPRSIIIIGNSPLIIHYLIGKGKPSWWDHKSIVWMGFFPYLWILKMQGSLMSEV